jgi:methionine aminopeptidase
MNIAQDELDRAAALQAAQAQAKALFAAFMQRSIIVAGRTESEIDAAIFALARKEFRIAKHWHKRIVRSGCNTLSTFSENPPDRIVGDDDIVIVDLGPVFGEWEADYGVTIVIDPDKERIVRATQSIYAATRSYYEANQSATGADIYAFVGDQARDLGFHFEASIAGHLISEFPHAQIAKPREVSLLIPQNMQRLRAPDAQGRTRYWILEVKLIEPRRRYAAFFEDFLNL